MSEIREKVIRKCNIKQLKEIAEAMELDDIPTGEEEKSRRKLMRAIVERFDDCEDGLDELVKHTVWPDDIKLEIERICHISEEDNSKRDEEVGPKQDIKMPTLPDMRATLQKARDEQELEDKIRRELEIRERVEEEFAQEKNNKSVLEKAITLGIKRELRIQGTIGGNDDKRLNYISLQSQVAEAKKKSYSDEEIAFALRRAVAAGSELRQYLDALGASISLNEIMDYIRSAYKEKTASELFNDLSQLKQLKDEENQDFLFRSLALKAKMKAAAKLEQEYEYGNGLIEATFKRAFYTGLRDAATRVHLKAMLRVDSKATDKELIDEVNKVSAEETEFTSKHVTKTSVRVVSVEDKIGEAMKPFCSTMAEMTAQLVAMQEEMKEMKAQRSYKPTHSATNQPRKRFGCKDCLQNNISCTHCFNCGKDDHRANKCPSKKSSNC